MTIIITIFYLLFVLTSDGVAVLVEFLQIDRGQETRDQPIAGMGRGRREWRD